jgi:hypothetical protein
MDNQSNYKMENAYKTAMTSNEGYYKIPLAKQLILFSK